MLCALVLLADVSAAAADGGHGGSASDYRVEIVAVSGTTAGKLAEGIEISVIELGDRLEVRRRGAAEVVVLGYDAEPYLRLDAAGVFENVRSPAAYLNRDRFADTLPPDSADSSAAPEWRRVGGGDVARWHDHRAHWMASIPPKEAHDDPGRSHVATVDAVPLLVDGAPVTVTVRVTWEPPPAQRAWWAFSAVGALVGAALLVRLRSVVAGAGAVVVSAVGLALSDEPSVARAIVAVCLAAIGIAIGRVRRADALALGAGVVFALGLTRLTVFEHPVLAGRVGETPMRIALAVCLAVSAAATVAGLFESFRPTTTQSPAGRP